MLDKKLMAMAAVIIGLGMGCGDDDDDGSEGAGGASGSDGTSGSGGAGDEISAYYPANGCVSAKQMGAGAYCKSVLEAWGAWESAQDDAVRDNAIADALEALEAAWSSAEDDAAEQGADCADAALTAAEAAAVIDEATSGLAESVNAGLELGDDAGCGADLLNAAARACAEALSAEGRHVADPGAEGAAVAREQGRTDALDAFSAAWQQAAGGCPTEATEQAVAGSIEQAVDDIVTSTIAASKLDDTGFTTISPTGTTEYLGKELTPVCMDGSPYHFFVKRGTVNKLLMYYQGGGACWENLTCSIPTCDANVDPEGGDNPGSYTTGFADMSNPDNPFRDWHFVFVSYCSCDIHFGDAAQDYPTHVEHRGYHNARYAEKWAREHFLAPEVVFVTGSSAGSYGALFNGALLHETWPAAQFHILGDAGNGVITTQFLQNEFGNWKFVDNLPDDIPGVLEAITSGAGMVAYMEAVAEYFPDTNWAHYSTAFDGGSGGQTGFYNVMLNDNNPVHAVTWWEGSCAFNEQMRLQAEQTYQKAGDNYRYYIGTGSRHTMFGSDKVYDDTTGGVPTVVDWVNAMLRSGPEGRDQEWTNVECDNCGLTLAGDPVPAPLAAPFEQQGDNIVIVCEE